MIEQRYTIPLNNLKRPPLNNGILKMKSTTPKIRLSTRPRRSVKLTETEMDKLAAFLDKYETEEDGALALGISRGAMRRIYKSGGGNEANVTKVKNKIKNVKVKVFVNR